MLVKKGQKVFVGLLKSKTTGANCHAIGLNERAVALNCFTQSLQNIPQQNWPKHTELINILQIQPNVFGFNMDDIEVSENHSVAYPAGSELVKKGAALVSLISPGDTGQVLDFKMSILRVDKKEVYDNYAN